MIALCMCVLLVPACWSLPLAGWIESPGYPHGYDPHANMTWERCAEKGHLMSLAFLHLDMEDSYQCENDAVKVFADKRLLTTLCGSMTAEQLQSTVNPLLYSSSGGCLSLSFQADYSNPERHTGFRAFYTIQDVDECWERDVECSHFCHNYIGGYSCSCKPGYFLSEDKHTCSVNCMEQRYGEGELVPPGSPGPYFENAHCIYTLSVEEGKQLVLSFSGPFDVESRDGQCVDYIKIKTISGTFGPYCGQEAPAPIVTTGQQVQVIFRTDQAGSNHGFSLIYKTKSMECPGTVTANSIVTPDKVVYTPGEEVTVQCITGHVKEGTDEKSYTSVCQKSGVWSPAYNCDPVDCGVPELSDLMELIEKDPPTTYGRHISLKCSSEYYQLVGDATFTCNADGVWESNGLVLSEDFPKCLSVCGRNMKTIAGGRIYGGKRAMLGHIPWQLLIKTPKRGGASLISDRWALTAAHVMDGLEERTLTFYGGMVDGLDKNAIEMQTEKIIIHPGYEKEKPEVDHLNYDNDIALIKMSARVPLSAHIRPVCLPEKTNGNKVMEGTVGTISGFGATERSSASQHLRYASVREFSVPCEESKLKVTDNMFCAGGDDEDVDSCKGDSGSALFQPVLVRGPVEKPYTIKGIVSWGASAVCGEGGFKGYYTKVENYLDWIRETMEKN